MQLSKFITTATKQLDDAGVPTSRLDTLVLIEDQLGIDRAKLLAHPELELSESDKNVLTVQIARRSLHEPLAYVRGMTEFYGRDFIVSSAVLEPRPESETMIDLFKQVLKNDSRLNRNDKNVSRSTPNCTKDAVVADSRDLKAGNSPIRVADVGSGSGAIGTTAKLEMPEISIDLLEIDDKALEISKANVDKYTTGISVIKSDLLAGSPQDYDVLLCNLPYVPDDFKINTAASHEPAIAIFGGPDGLDLYRKLFDQIKIVEKKPLYIIIENLPFQHAKSERIAASAGYKILDTNDFIQVFIGPKN